MNKFRVLKYITLILLVVILIVSYSQVDASTDLSLAKGNGKRNTVAFEFIVIHKPSGLVKGDFLWDNPGFLPIEGTIDCASINGNIAIFGGIVEGSNIPFTVKVSDNPDGQTEAQDDGLKAPQREILAQQHFKSLGMR